MTATATPAVRLDPDPDGVHLDRYRSVTTSPGMHLIEVHHPSGIRVYVEHRAGPTVLATAAAAAAATARGATLIRVVTAGDPPPGNVAATGAVIVIDLEPAITAPGAVRVRIRDAVAIPVASRCGRYSWMQPTPITSRQLGQMRSFLPVGLEDAG